MFDIQKAADMAEAAALTLDPWSPRGDYAYKMIARASDYRASATWVAGFDTIGGQAERYLAKALACYRDAYMQTL